MGWVVVSVRDKTLGDRWFASQGWTPFPFQRETWRAIANGESGLVHATTGSGKTHAVWLGALNAMIPKSGKLGSEW